MNGSGWSDGSNGSGWTDRTGGYGTNRTRTSGVWRAAVDDDTRWPRRCGGAG